MSDRGFTGKCESLLFTLRYTITASLISNVHYGIGVLLEVLCPNVMFCFPLVVIICYYTDLIFQCTKRHDREMFFKDGPTADQYKVMEPI